jgi:hypothetical protein
MEYKYSLKKVWVGGGMQSVFIMDPTPSSFFYFFGGNAKNVGPF